MKPLTAEQLTDEGLERLAEEWAQNWERGDPVPLADLLKAVLQLIKLALSGQKEQG